MKFKVLVFLLVFASIFSKEYVVGVEDISYYPHYESIDGVFQDSYSKAILDLFSEYSGHKLVYKPLPVKRLFRSIVNGSIDFKYPDNEYWSADDKKGADIKYSKGEYKLSSKLHHDIIDEFDKFLVEKKDEIEKLKKKYQVD